MNLDQLESIVKNGNAITKYFDLVKEIISLVQADKKTDKAEIKQDVEKLIKTVDAIVNDFVAVPDIIDNLVVTYLPELVDKYVVDNLIPDNPNVATVN